MSVARTQSASERVEPCFKKIERFARDPFS